MCDIMQDIYTDWDVAESYSMHASFVANLLKLKIVKVIDNCHDSRVHDYCRPPPPLTHTHTRKQRKISTLECKENGQMLRISDHKNVNKSKNRLTPLKL